MLRIFEAGDVAGAHAHFVQAGKIGARFAHRELVTLGADRRRPHADLPRRHRRRDGPARRGHGVHRSRRAVTARDRRRLLLGDRRLLGAVRPRPMPSVDAIVRPMVRHPTRTRALPGSLLLAPRRGARAARGVARGARRGSTRLRSARRTRQPAASAGACAIEGDLLRLAGDLDGAEAAYQRASEHGRDPQPGLALLRLAQGRSTPPTP